MILSVVLGGTITLAVSFIFHWIGSRNLEQKINRLEEVNVDLQVMRQKQELDTKWGDISGDRKNLFLLAREAYSIWKCSEDIRFTSLDNLVVAAPPPPGLPLKAGVSVISWAATEPTEWKGAAKILWQFARALLPATGNVENQTSTNLLSEEKFELFDRARRSHAYFFNQVARAYLESKNKNAFNAYVVDQFFIRKLIVYLDLAQVLRCPVSPQKDLLYRLPW